MPVGLVSSRISVFSVFSVFSVLSGIIVAFRNRDFWAATIYTFFDITHILSSQPWILKLVLSITTGQAWVLSTGASGIGGDWSVIWLRHIWYLVWYSVVWSGHIQGCAKKNESCRIILKHVWTFYTLFTTDLYYENCQRKP